MRKAFTLIELLIVILIVSMVYYLGFNGIESIKKEKRINIMNVKQDIIAMDWYERGMTLICTEKSNSCYTLTNTLTKKDNLQNYIDFEVKNTYMLDMYGEMKKIEQGRLLDKKIMFILNFKKDGYTDKVVWEVGEYFYLIPSYFGEIKKFDNLDDVKSFWILGKKEIKNGEFY